MLPRPEQASLILTEVDLPVVAGLTLAEETFRGESRAKARSITKHFRGTLNWIQPLLGSTREKERERECARERLKIQVAPSGDFNQLFASATAREESRGACRAIPGTRVWLQVRHGRDFRNNTMGPR